jgi:uncharacterized membrane protein
MRDRTGWQSVGEWALAGGLFALALIGIMSIGVFVLPFALLAFVLAERRNRPLPEAPLGASIGAGSVCLFIAYRNRGYSPCPQSGRIHLAPGEHFSCGGFDPTPWLVVGGLLVAAGLVGHVVFRRASHSVAC